MSKPSASTRFSTKDPVLSEAGCSWISVMSSSCSCGRDSKRLHQDCPALPGQADGVAFRVVRMLLPVPELDGVLDHEPATLVPALGVAAERLLERKPVRGELAEDDRVLDGDPGSEGQVR